MITIKKLPSKIVFELVGDKITESLVERFQSISRLIIDKVFAPDLLTQFDFELPQGVSHEIYDEIHVLDDHIENFIKKNNGKVLTSAVSVGCNPQKPLISFSKFELKQLDEKVHEDIDISGFGRLNGYSISGNSISIRPIINGDVTNPHDFALKNPRLIANIFPLKSFEVDLVYKGYIRKNSNNKELFFITNIEVLDEVPTGPNDLFAQ